MGYKNYEHTVFHYKNVHMHVVDCCSMRIFDKFYQNDNKQCQINSLDSFSLQIYLMERLEQKQLQKIKELKQEKQRKQMDVVKKMLEDDYVATVFNYCKKVLMEPLTESLSDYSPSHLSKFMFQQQLQKAKDLFDSFPDQQCNIEQFLLLMISIMKFPFEKWPYYLVGAKDMFNEILAQRAKSISYQNFFKYVIGEVLDFKEQQQNTEFQVRFEQLKKQDYLLHDTGVKKFHYSPDTKYYMTLDQSSPIIKLYNKQMRMVQKFSPNKEKHNKKFPNIIHFDYSEMSSKLGIVLSDSTFSIINLHNYLTKSKYDFELNGSNQIVVNFEDKMVMVWYIQMINKWLLVSENNQMFTFDYQKYKQNDPQYLHQIKLENPDLKITLVLELVSLSMICVVAGNQVYFFNESLNQIKHNKFIHGTNIRAFRYSEEQGLFYLCGDEKFITIVTLIKASNSFQIKTFDIQSKYDVCTFEVFPVVGTIVAVDKSNEVKLFDLAQGTCYQSANYSNIVKKQNGQIKMLKTSKTQFALYETYTLVFHQQKIAIEKDTQFSFLSKIYYDEAKEQFYVSVNNQIISFSVFQGQIRKSFNLQTANVPKHDAFILGKQTNLFIIDHEKSIYEAYLKDKAIDGENKNYKKKVGVSHVVDMFYDEDIRYAFIVGENTIHAVRNDGLNNFSVNSVLNLEKLPDIFAAKYNCHQKYILALTKDQKWLVIDVETYKLLSYSCYIFPNDPNDHEQIMVQQFEQDQFYNMDILLNNRNQLYFLSRDNSQLKVVLKIQDFLPYKLKNLQFSNMRYCQVPKSHKKYILLSDKSGYLIEINVTSILSKNFKQCQLERKSYRYPLKDLHNIQYSGEKPAQVKLSGSKNANLDKKDFILFKGHDKEIRIMAKVNIEGIRTLTISADGHIKLWQDQEMLFFLKLPDLKKVVWNMSKIQTIKNERSVNEVVTVMNKITKSIETKMSPQMILKKSNKLKVYEEVKKFNINEPIQIEIDNKDLEDFVYKTQNINWYNYRNESRKRQRDLSLTQRNTNYHPWRTKHQFRKIMEKASPENKYAKKMPLDLVNLRTSLDMKQRSARLSKDYQGELTILPQINAYVPESKNLSVKQKQQNQTEQNENEQAFESCLYVKNKKDKRKINEFDEIDKQFKKKWLQLTNKKYIPKSEPKKKANDKNNTGKPKAQQQKKLYFAPMNMVRYDPVKQVKSIFENYNREASITKKGRLIKIPDIKLTREDLFSND